MRRGDLTSKQRNGVVDGAHRERRHNINNHSTRKDTSLDGPPAVTANKGAGGRSSARATPPPLRARDGRWGGGAPDHDTQQRGWWAHPQQIGGGGRPGPQERGVTLRRPQKREQCGPGEARRGGVTSRDGKGGQHYGRERPTAPEGWPQPLGRGIVPPEGPKRKKMGRRRPEKKV